MWDEEEKDWCDWYLETEDYYYDDIDEYCESNDCPNSEKLIEDKEDIFKQIDWSRMPN